MISANPFYFPLIVLIWLIELYLFLATCRLVMIKIPSARQTHFYQQLKLLTDFVPYAVCKKLFRSKSQSISWIAWVLVLLFGFILRQILIVIVSL